LVVNCPHCRTAVLRNADGTCPACGKSIPPESLDPLVVQSTYASAGTPVDAPAAGSRVNPAWAERVDAFARFRQQLWKNTPRVYMTKTIVMINVAIFILMVLSGAGLMSPNVDTLIRWGANDGPETLAGQWWRLFTCMFVHAGLLHVAINMWVLWDVGNLLERLTGNIGYLVLYILSGLFGSLASVYWNPQVVSVGASGAVFGVFGGLMGFLMLRSDSVPKHFLASMRRSGFMFLMYNVIFGLAIPRIDMAAHAGGFVSGVLFGAILSQPLYEVTARKRRIRNLAAIAVGMLGLAAALWAAPQPPMSLRLEVMRLQEVEKQVESAYNDAAGQAEAGHLSDQQFAQVIQSKVLQPWQTLQSRFDDLDETDLSDQQKQMLSTVHQYLRQQAQRWKYELAVLSELAAFDAFEPAAIKSWNDALHKQRQGQVYDQDLADYLESELLPAWKTMQKRLDQLDFRVLPQAIRERAEKKRTYMHLREQAWNSYIAAVKVEDPDLLEDYRKNTAAAEAIAAELRSD